MIGEEIDRFIQWVSTPFVYIVLGTMMSGPIAALWAVIALVEAAVIAALLLL